jgi:hypothetical protein
MASIDWPHILPSGLLAAGFSKQPRNNVIRTAMEAGPNKTRRRYTSRAVIVKGKQIFDAMELAVFEEFYHTVLADGALRFNFADPLSLETAEFRFTQDYAVTENSGLFEIAMSLERL